MKSQSKETNHTTTTLLTMAHTDELVNAASQPADGAVEDCEVTENAATYFFESGAVGTVSRVTGAVQITTTPRSR